ncbi:MAG: electron transport complex subunit RsxC [Acetobacteraceae bacterium]|nr:electron transport complex subunit RsxC [Acetobacteraceae bacterium]
MRLPAQKHLTLGRPLEEAPDPGRVAILLRQHPGPPCRALVHEGDDVLLGQKVGEPESALAAPVHASVSGRVEAVEPWPHPDGGEALAVVIASDGLDRRCPGLEPAPDPLSLPPAELVSRIREAGIVGMGGAGFPTSAKLDLPAGARIDAYLLNGAECEPYLTSDHRLLVERAGTVVRGFLALMRAVGAPRGLVALERGRHGAAEALRAAIEAEPALSDPQSRGAAPHIEVVLLPERYPWGSERHLIRGLLGRTVPSGCFPVHVGVLVSNVATAAAVAEALYLGLPLIRRAVTVSGPGVARPSNLWARIGTPAEVLIEHCGGYSAPPARLILGGPMMGRAQPTARVPITKTTSGVLVFTAAEDGREPPPSPCIRCGRCVGACPMGLLPGVLAELAERGLLEEADRWHLRDCVECGCCAYVCPAGRPLVQAIRLAKAELAGAGEAVGPRSEPAPAATAGAAGTGTDVAEVKGGRASGGTGAAPGRQGGG